ncbi:hypothetical protein GXW74_22100 [Roseomonas eburnea]|uniref:Uncharacterized protein n=1 Tax=Neoroseomonas eburnea TaxID=1346889 RepID=A0A9X9XHL1_9PROT|nr:hypothetical protein [Neoroseomonas eburnea]MBR0683197.1 hypothetical protein [Neoroseomonas eburnea]
METIALGPFAVTPDGALAPLAADPAPALRFAWRGRACRAEVAADGLRLAADAARIPSTAEPGADRRRAFAAVARLPAHLPSGWRARLLPDHRLRLEASAPLAAPANATALVASLVRFVLALDPYLDSLEAAGVAWPPGTSRT